MTHDDKRPIVTEDTLVFEFEDAGDADQELTVDELFDHAGYKFTSMLTTAGAGLSLFLYGTLIQYITLLCQYLECREEITIAEVVAIKILAILGFIIGLPLNGMVADKIGRVSTARAGAYLVTLCWLFSSISITLLFATILCVGAGFAVLLPSSIVFAFENSSLRQHTRVALILFGEYILGQVFALVLFKTAIEAIGWHWMTIILVLPSVLLIVFYHLAHDTPRFLAISGRHNKAYEDLLWLHKMNKVPMMQGRLKAQEIAERGECCSPCNMVYMKSTVLLIVLFFALSFCYYSTSYGVYMSLLTTGFCSTETVIGNIECDADDNTTLVNSLIALVPDFLGLLVALFLCEVAGRRSCLLILATVAGIAILTATYCTQAVLTLIELGLARGLMFGALVVVYVYTLERFSTDKRCLSFSYLFTFGLIGMYFAGSITFGLRSHPYVILILLGITLFLSLVPMWFLDKLGLKDVDDDLDEQQSLTSIN